jgi:hypothetical protein
MKKLSHIVGRTSLQDIVEKMASTMHDGETTPEAKAGDEKKFVKFHKTEKFRDVAGNKCDVYNASNVKTHDRESTRQGHGPDEDDHDDSFSPKNEEEDRTTHNKFSPKKDADKKGPNTPDFKAMVSNAVKRHKGVIKKSGLGEETLDEGGPTRKHFRATAETVSAIEHEGKRKEHASAHADRYARENPRFNRSKFMQACGVKE